MGNGVGSGPPKLLDFKGFIEAFSSERYFVIIKVYADESGTHDKTGRQKGSQVPVIAGYLASAEYWKSFNDNWQSVLKHKKYGVDYFHNKELGFHHRQKTTFARHLR